MSSTEAHKLVNPSQFGPIFGLPRSPDPVTIRTYLEIMAEQHILDSVVDKFALQVLKIGAVNPDVFFVDGHFLPYYGFNLLLKGWHTVRCQALKGNEIYVVSDIEKRPLMFITEGCEIDFRPIIHRLAGKIIDYGIKRPVLVFDRSGYGVHFFSELGRYADFVTWGKSENFFKEIMSIFSFNDHSGYVIDEMEQQPLFDNPEVAIIRSAVKSIKKEIKRIEGDKAILQLNYQKTGKQKTVVMIDTLEKRYVRNLSIRQALKKSWRNCLKK